MTSCSFPLRTSNVGQQQPPHMTAQQTSNQLGMASIPMNANYAGNTAANNIAPMNRMQTVPIATTGQPQAYPPQYHQMYQSTNRSNALPTGGVFPQSALNTNKIPTQPNSMQQSQVGQPTPSNMMATGNPTQYMMSMNPAYPSNFQYTQQQQQQTQSTSQGYYAPQQVGMTTAQGNLQNTATMHAYYQQMMNQPMPNPGLYNYRVPQQGMTGNPMPTANQSYVPQAMAMQQLQQQQQQQQLHQQQHMSLAAAQQQQQQQQQIMNASSTIQQQQQPLQQQVSQPPSSDVNKTN
jgi:hypothetical protein